MKKGFFFLFTLVTILLLAACSNDENPKTEDNNSGIASETSSTSSGKNSITIGITNPPGAFNPILLSDITGLMVSQLIYAPLVMQNEDLSFTNQLASSIETTDNQTFTVTLHEKAVWSDGETLDADDVLFTANMIGHPESGASIPGISILKGFGNNGLLEGSELTGVVKVDDRTIQFITDVPVDQDLFNSVLAVQFKTIPEHIFNQIEPAELATSELLQAPPVASGPFTFKEYATNQYIELIANDTYFAGRPKIDALYLKIMTAANIVAQLQSGEIDMNWPGIGTIASSDFERVENLTNVVSEYGIPLDYQLLSLNLNTFEDKRVRQAIAMGINREMIANNLLKGKATISDFIYSPNNQYYNKNLELYEYNPEQAQKLLKEAKWDTNKQLTMLVPSGNTTREQAADLIAQNLNGIGIKVQVEKYDIATVIAKAREKSSDMVILGFPYTHDPDVRSFYSTGELNNLTNYSNEKVDELLVKGVQATDPIERKKYYDEFQEIIHDEVPTFVLYFDLRLLAKNERVQVGGPKQVGGLVNVHLWEVK